MKKNILSLAALLIASATFVACSNDDNIINEQPAQPTGKYTMTVNASKGDGTTTRALTLTGKTLNASWATTENIYVKSGETWASGSLKPDANDATATLKGEFSGITIAKDDVLTLQFPKSGDISYNGQGGYAGRHCRQLRLRHGIGHGGKRLGHGQHHPQGDHDHIHEPTGHREVHARGQG